jgi:hypothetical protein
MVSGLRFRRWKTEARFDSRWISIAICDAPVLEERDVVASGNVFDQDRRGT